MFDIMLSMLYNIKLFFPLTLINHNLSNTNVRFSCREVGTLHRYTVKPWTSITNCARRTHWEAHLIRRISAEYFVLGRGPMMRPTINEESDCLRKKFLLRFRLFKLFRFFLCLFSPSYSWIATSVQCHRNAQYYEHSMCND